MSKKNTRKFRGACHEVPEVGVRLALFVVAGLQIQVPLLSTDYTDYQVGTSVLLSDFQGTVSYSIDFKKLNVFGNLSFYSLYFIYHM